MKKYIIGALILVCIHGVGFAADLTRYQQMYVLEELPVTQPAITQLSNLDPNKIYVVATDKGQTVEQQFQTTRAVRIIQPTSVEACTSSCTQANTLADSDQNTTFDFPLATSGSQKGTIKIVYAKPLETNQIVFETTRDSYMPSEFTLMIDGKRILNTIQGSAATFPKMMAQSIVIEFSYNQPIRFREVGVGFNREEVVNNMIRFVYQPSTKYVLYEGTQIARENTPTPPINLFAKSKESELRLAEAVKNPLYVEKVPEMNKDSDADGVINLNDNCPLQANRFQEDSNGNGIGDVCDDYDYDGVETYRDNCSTISNFDQADVDRDGIGDVCDQEESRYTERHKWIPLAAFFFVLLAISAMGYDVVRKMKK